MIAMVCVLAAPLISRSAIDAYRPGVPREVLADAVVPLVIVCVAWGCLVDGAAIHTYWLHWWILPGSLGVGLLVDSVGSLSPFGRHIAVAAVVVGALPALALVPPDLAAQRAAARRGIPIAAAIYPREQTTAWVASSDDQPVDWIGFVSRRPAMHIGRLALHDVAIRRPDDLVAVVPRAPTQVDEPGSPCVTRGPGGIGVASARLVDGAVDHDAVRGCRP